MTTKGIPGIMAESFLIFLIPFRQMPSNHLNYVPQSVNEVKNAWFYTSTPPYVDMTWSLINLASP